MRVFLHIGLPHCGPGRIQTWLDDRRGLLAGKGVLYPQSPGARNHTKLYLAALDPDHLDPLRVARGFADPVRQAALADAVTADLQSEIRRAKPEAVILSASQLAQLRPPEITRLHAMIAPLSDRITVIAHVDHQSRILARHYEEQVLLGRRAGLSVELALARSIQDAAGPFGSTSSGGTPSGGTSSGGTASGGTSSGGTPSGTRPTKARPSAARPSTAGPSVARPSASRPPHAGKGAPGLAADPAGADVEWWDCALALWQPVGQGDADFPEIQSPPHWLDLKRLVTEWGAVFGPSALSLRPGPGFWSGADNAEATAAEARTAFDLPAQASRASGAAGRTNVDAADPDARAAAASHISSRMIPPPPAAPPPAPAAWLTRARMVNAIFAQLVARDRVIPRKLWRRLLAELAVPGPPLAPGAFGPLTSAFARQNAALIAAFPDLALALAPDPALPERVEADPGPGFRATQYAAAFLPRIDRATAEAAAAATAAPQGADAGGQPSAPGVLSPSAERLMPPLARANVAYLSKGRLAPHNRLGKVAEETPGPPYMPAVHPAPAAGRRGTVIVACMKNEAPYIAEWIAYHRVIGVDGFLIYTNGCEDGTTEILDRMAALGLVEHRDNNEWKGKSPQQAALNRAVDEPILRDADWIAHIDVDEFMNIRSGNGTLTDLYAAIPGATNLAMTWRLFGHNGVTRFIDRPVIAQFDTCAPKWAPKPHTTWGFKSLMKNIGAYSKLSCHRPNKLDESRRADVAWVNGSGAPMGEAIKINGWRSSTDTIGYDLIQLNHYALRSAESFLVKRQRGRALHVDRSIGLNYWVRMDWGYHTDRTIQRNLPRLQAEMARMMADPDLARLHADGVAWHRARADDLHANPEFSDLYGQALDVHLTEVERVAFALALDMES